MGAKKSLAFSLRYKVLPPNLVPHLLPKLFMDNKNSFVLSKKLFHLDAKIFQWSHTEMFVCPFYIFFVFVFLHILHSLYWDLFLWSSGKGQARIGKGWPSRQKASKLKLLPRAYTKVGCHRHHPPPEVSLQLTNGLILARWGKWR